jgi:cephalosporin-C deacetylase
LCTTQQPLGAIDTLDLLNPIAPGNVVPTAVASKELLVLVDLPLEELRRLKARATEPPDFDEFWSSTLHTTRASTATATEVPYDSGLNTVDVFDVHFPGWNGEPIAAWLYLPRGVDPTVTVVQYVGYSGGRGFAFNNLVWSAAGHAHLFVDTRGQGWNMNSTADTPDSPASLPSQAPGMMTRGIDSPANFYYRRVFSDAVRAIDFVRGHQKLRHTKIVVTGGSQGGGITLAVAGLVDGLAAALPDVPFLCDIRRATEITDAYPYREISDYCRAHREAVEDVFTTLSYFDAANFATRATAPALFSVALMDETCPPSTVFAAYNNYAAEKSIEVYPYNGHEGGSGFQLQKQLALVDRLR